MLLLLSPSKTQNFVGPCPEEHTLPAFLPEIGMLVKELRGLDRQALAALMGISEQLADATWLNFQKFSTTFGPENARPAIFAFQGAVYAGLRAAQFSEDDLNFAQGHLRILSGLYGLLQPLDLIQPYRLEMKTKLRTIGGEDLYAFWDNKITDRLNGDLEKVDGPLVNLASQEYFKAVRPTLLKRPVLHIAFKVKKNGQYKIIAIHAKRARGLMANFVISHRLTDSDELKKFKEEGYRFNASLSSELELVFCKG